MNDRHVSFVFRVVVEDEPIDGQSLLKQQVPIKSAIETSAYELIHSREGRQRPRCHHAGERVNVTMLRIGVFSEKTLARHEFRSTYLFEFRNQLKIVSVCKLSYLI